LKFGLKDLLSVAFLLRGIQLLLPARHGQPRVPGVVHLKCPGASWLAGHLILIPWHQLGVSGWYTRGVMEYFLATSHTL